MCKGFHAESHTFLSGQVDSVACASQSASACLMATHTQAKLMRSISAQRQSEQCSATGYAWGPCSFSGKVEALRLVARQSAVAATIQLQRAFATHPASALMTAAMTMPKLAQSHYQPSSWGMSICSSLQTCTPGSKGAATMRP